MKKLALLLCALALLSGCKGKEEARWTPPPLPSTPLPSPTAEPSWWESLRADQLPTAMASAEDLGNMGDEEVRLLARVGDDALYGLGGGSGVVVLRDGELMHFEQTFFSPDAPALPTLFRSDYDGDGADELAARYLVEAQGDRVVYDLHIYEEDGDRHLTGAQCAEMALGEVELDYNSSTGTVTLSYGRTSASCQVPDSYRQSPGRLTLDTCFFREADGVFTVVLGARVDAAGALYANIVADIAYDGTDFTLQNIKVEPTTGV